MKRLLLPILLSINATAGFAAEQADNYNLWINYVGDHPLFGSKFGLHLEVQNRREDWGEEWQQLLLRPGINYAIDDTLSVSVGYGFIKTYPYGELPVLHEFDEHRVWEQLLYRASWLGLNWQHRLRFEQRWIEDVGYTPATASWSRREWRLENRVRYLLRTEIPLTADKKYYIPIWDEVFVNFGGNLSRNHFDQNRFFIGIGRKLGPSTRLEIGFLEQTLQRRGGDRWENNHTVSLWLISAWPFGKS